MLEVGDEHLINSTPYSSDKLKNRNVSILDTTYGKQRASQSDASLSNDKKRPGKQLQGPYIAGAQKPPPYRRINFIRDTSHLPHLSL